MIVAGVNIVEELAKDDEAIVAAQAADDVFTVMKAEDENLEPFADKPWVVGNGYSFKKHEDTYFIVSPYGAQIVKRDRGMR